MEKKTQEIAAGSGWNECLGSTAVAAWAAAFRAEEAA
jgi:hypothetical protein